MKRNAVEVDERNVANFKWDEKWNAIISRWSGWSVNTCQKFIHSHHHMLKTVCACHILHTKTHETLFCRSAIAAKVTFQLSKWIFFFGLGCECMRVVDVCERNVQMYLLNINFPIRGNLSVLRNQNRWWDSMDWVEFCVIQKIAICKWLQLKHRFYGSDLFVGIRVKENHVTDTNKVMAWVEDSSNVCG